MMSGRLYIDGEDAYTEYGVYVVYGGWNELIAFPPLKSVDMNDWYEEDGIEADLSMPVLNSRELSLKLAFCGGYELFSELISLLSDGAYHDFNCASIKRLYKLRLISQPNLDTTGYAVIKLADDFPLGGYKYVSPLSSVLAKEDYALDGRLFTDYGVRVLNGTLSELIKAPNVKSNLLRNINSKSGAIYDDENVKFKSKDVKINCLLRAQNLDELWRNYDALLFDLTRPNERMLRVNELGIELPCYYKQCQVIDFYPKDKIWLQFQLTLTVTRNYRIWENYTALTSESGVVIITEDGNNVIEI